MPHWTITHMGRLDGKTAIVTGANSGLGYQATKALADKGAHVIMACRDSGRAAKALERLRSEVVEPSAEVRALDLASLESIREFADGVTVPINILVNNAGVMALPKRLTVDGFEMQFGTNHLGHFALTGRLLPRLLAEPGTRVVTVSSDVHRIGKIDFDNLQGEKSYGKWKAYGQSKLANLLFATELGRRAAAAGADLVSLAAHPGFAATNLQAAGPKMSGSKVGAAVAGVGNKLFAQSDANGALPLLYAVTSPDAVSGEYAGPSGPFGSRGSGVKPAPRSKRASDDVTARRLWDVSETLTHVTYDFAAAEPKKSAPAAKKAAPAKKTPPAKKE
ncbi:MAG: family NAD(P)-dependent oxidoreductase [Mycobacterium sp.]|nr:family NAD(P)-dependent oxidoreductase [Mycobacterium sp.]